jgi:hypothetical protein
MTTQDGITVAVEGWLRGALEDAERRGLPELKPLLGGLAKSTIALRRADWNDCVPQKKAAGGTGDCKPHEGTAAEQ